ncbi:hypothetical protein Tco_0232071 [Tanacetum coccineum]
MLLVGSELTKEDIESQLYDEFERFKMLPGENINEYYVRFHKLVNDMRNIIMTMPNIHLNSKFVNNMSPEWDRFVIADGRVVVQNVQGRQNQNQRNFARGAGVEGNEGAQNRAGNAKADKMMLMQAQENGAVLDEEELLFLAGELTNTFDADVDNQPKHVIESNGADMGNSNVIPYEQYLTINEVSVEPSCASFVSNDAYVLHDNNAYIPHDPLVTELNIYKQQVAMYEQRTKFDLTLCE